MLNRWKLMNVSQIRITQLGVDQDIRAHCVEITSEPNLSLIVAYSLFDDELNPRMEIVPRIVAKIRIPCSVRVVDALEHDGQSWAIQSPNVNLLIRPYQEEHIWLDRSFGAESISDTLRELYAQKRGCMLSLVLHERLLLHTPPTDPAALAQHQQVVTDMRAMVGQIDRRILKMEVTNG